jgi:two-component system, OmpR family, sensor histidine kinase BaeS
VIELALVVACVTAVAAIVVVLALRLLPTVRLQLAGLALCCVVLPLLAVLLSGWVMFGMGDDLKILAVSSAAASAAVAAGLLLGRLTGRRIERLRDTAREFARGDLGARAPVEGPAELAELSATFNDMAGQLAALFDSRSELVAWASHDLRTPVASLKAMLEAVEDGVADADEYLPQIHAQVLTLEALVEDLFELACIDAGAATVETQATDLSELVRSCVDEVRPEAEIDGVALEALTNGSLRASCAPQKTARVLRNLLANALRHTPRGGSIVVSVGAHDGVAQVCVADTGEGVPEQEQERMFERFWRGDDSRTSGRAGAGLGLAIARGLVEAQGGHIWAAPRIGGGLEVGFTLPRAKRG